MDLSKKMSTLLIIKYTSMKKVIVLAFVAVATIFAFYACKKDVNSNSSTEGEIATKPPVQQPPGSSCANYSVTLDRTYEDGKTTFIWTITNPNPGNGQNGTIQNLSHWNFIPGCPGNDGLEQNWDDIDAAYYSTDGGTTWNLISPTPELAPDPSQTCTNLNVFKFNYGTSGSQPTLYKLVLFGNYSADANNTAVFKSGANTGCCVRTVPGIGCKTEETCSLSQGYYFAKPPYTWPFEVTVGGHTYNEDEGRAIFNCSNAGGIKDSKKGFTQVAALKLSGAYPTGDALIDADVATVEAYLASLNKLVACTYLPTGNAAAAAAAGRIGDWINANHCNDTSTEE